MKPLKAYDKRHFEIFGEHKVFDVISIDYRNKTVLLDAGKYGEIPRMFSQAVMMQPTGIKDENKREIYEGDIVEYTQHLFNSQDVKRKRKAIKYDIIQAKFNIYETRAGESDFEIIGNVYENPELLKQ